MKNFTLSILFAATCQLASVVGVQHADVETMQQLRICIVESLNASHDQQALFRKVEDAPEVAEKTSNASFGLAKEGKSFTPFYFARKVELRSRSSLDADHIS